MAKPYAYWILSGRYSMLQKLTTIGTGLVTFMLLARHLPPVSFGIWGLFAIIASMVETSRGAWIRNGYVVFINKHDAESHPFTEGAALVANIVFTLLVLLLFGIGGGWLETLLKAPGLSTVLYVYCGTLLLLVPFSQLENRCNANTHFKAVFWMYAVRNGVFSLAVILAVVANLSIGLHHLAIAYAVGVALGVGAGYWAGRDLPLVVYRWHKARFRNFIHYGKFVFGNNLCSLLFRNTDSFFTTRFVSPAALAFYNTSTRITNLTDLPTQVLGDIMFPRVARIVRDGAVADIRRLYEKSVAATLCFAVPATVVVCLFAEPIIQVLAGSQYLNAAPVLRISILYGLFLPFVKQFGNVMDATGRPHGNFLVMMGAALFNAAVNLLAIHYLGFIGPAYGTLCSYICLFLVTQVILVRLIGISHLRVLQELFGFYAGIARMVAGKLQQINVYRYEK